MQPRSGLVDRLAHDVRSLAPAHDSFDLLPPLNPIPRALVLFGPGRGEGVGEGAGEEEELEVVDGGGDELRILEILCGGIWVGRGAREDGKLSDVGGLVREEAS